MFYGRGAGGEPTASAVLGDLVDAAVNLAPWSPRLGRQAGAGAPAAGRGLHRPPYYLSLEAADRPGVLAAVAGVFGEHGVSIASMEQESLPAAGRPTPASLASTSSPTRRGSATCRPPSPPCGDLDVVHRVGSVIRVLEPEDDLMAAPITYVSTRGTAPTLGFADVLLAGLARDGGLYVPVRWPPLSPADAEPARRAAPTPRWPSRSCGRSSRAPSTTTSSRRIVGRRRTPRSTPPTWCRSRDLGDGIWLAELFHGPTLAFKDVALQLVGRLFDHELTRRGERVTIVGATSGDTGSAAIEACRDRDAIDVFILHPAGRVSEVQRRQMTTVLSPNVHNIAVEGTFDDCQDLVKALFADEAFRDRRQLSAVNSHQLGPGDGPDRLLRHRRRSRLGAGGRPTGRLLRAHRQLRQRLRRLRRPAHGRARSRSSWSASNRNDILTRFLTSGTMTIGEVHPTLSPSMDIQVSSQPRAAAVRALRPRRRADRRAHGPVPRRAARSRSTPVASTCWPSTGPRRGSTTTARAAIIAELYERTGHAHRSAHGGGPGRRGLRGAAPIRRADGRALHRPPGQVPRRGRGGHRRAAAAARPPGRPVRAAGALRRSCANDVDRRARPASNRPSTASAERSARGASTRHLPKWSRIAG